MNLAGCRYNLFPALILLLPLSGAVLAGTTAQPPTGPESPAQGPAYHDYDALTAALQLVAADHPEITRLISAGPSVEGRELWWLKITDNPDVEEDEPGFKYISTMHGDEPVGTELCLQLIELLTDGYETDPRLTHLIDEVEIWVMPMMNPDGNARRMRLNANLVDLNRDFPDHWRDPVNTPLGRQPETQHIMNWQADHSTVLSANFHTGALVVRYPYDNNEPGTSGYAAAPDDDIIRDLAIEYSDDNLPMFNGEFIDGIVNGADWSVLSGGMQDWNYVYNGDIEVTVELNDRKWPPANQLDRLWLENRESMIAYMERALTGVRGVVTNQETGEPVSARLIIEGRDIPFYTDPEVGDFHRPAVAGSFTLVVEAGGYGGRTVPFTIADSEADAVRVDVALVPNPTDIGYAGNRVAEDSGADGWLDPGESGRIAVSLHNGGRVATGLSGSLKSLTPHAAGTDVSIWPDLHPDEEAESVPPHFGVLVSPGTPAGHMLSFAVEWESAEGQGGTTEAFFVPVSAPIQYLQQATDLPQDIVDNQTILSTIDIPFDQRIDEANVRVDITHTFIGDVQVVLVAPGGEEYRLHDRTGGSSDDLNTWYDTETEPVDSLDPLGGTSSLGTWTLRVTDVADKDQGTLDSWALELYTSPFEDPLAEVVLRNVDKTENGNVRIRWWAGGTADSYKVYRSDDPSSQSAFADVTLEDPDDTDTLFESASPGDVSYWIVTGVGHTGEGLWGHYGR